MTNVVAFRSGDIAGTVLDSPQYVRDALLELQKPQKRYLSDEAFYEGNVTEFFPNATLEMLYTDTGDAYRMNFVATVVDAVLERTEVASISCPDKVALTYLDSVWEENELDIESKDAHLNAYEYGDSYLIAMPDEEMECGLSAYVHTPKNVRVIYYPDKPRKAMMAFHAYHVVGEGTDDPDDNQLPLGDTFLMLVIYSVIDDTIEHWRSTNPIPRIDGKLQDVEYSTVEMTLHDEDDLPVPGTLPVFHFRTKKPYGVSLTKDAKGAQNALTKTLIVAMTSIDSAGYPQRYEALEKDDAKTALGTPNPADRHQGQPFLPFGDAWDLQSNRVIGGQYKSGPGEIMKFSGKSLTLGEFAVAESQNFINMLDWILGALSRVTDIPTHYFTTGAQAPSGESYRKGEQPLVAKVKSYERLFGSTWNAFFDYALKLKGMKAAKAQIVWVNPGDIQSTDYWEMQTAKEELGMPRVEVFVEAGYDREEVEKWDEKNSFVEAPSSAQFQDMIQAPEASLLPDPLNAPGTTVLAPPAPTASATPPAKAAPAKAAPPVKAVPNPRKS